MNPIYEKLEKCYQCVREKTDFVPEVAIILGSGFGQFADEYAVPFSLPNSRHQK